MYCSYLQDNWKKWLLLAEFTVNNVENEIMKTILFYANYEQHSWLEFEFQTEIDEHDLMIKQLQQIDANNFIN